jgi:hypothetical protein
VDLKSWRGRSPSDDPTTVSNRFPQSSNRGHPRTDQRPDHHLLLRTGRVTASPRFAADHRRRALDSRPWCRIPHRAGCYAMRSRWRTKAEATYRLFRCPDRPVIDSGRGYSGDELWRRLPTIAPETTLCTTSVTVRSSQAQIRGPIGDANPGRRQ